MQATIKNLIGQRLRVEMKKRGVSSADLSRRADVKTSFLYDVMSGKSANPSTVKLARVAEVLSVSLAYLVGSTNSPVPETSAGSPGKDYVTVPRISVEASAVVSHETEAERYYFRREWIKEHLNASPADVRMVAVRGDSMEPTLCHNDVILVDTAKKTPSPPGIFVLFDGFGLVVKRLEHVGGSPQLRIISDNPQYSTAERPIADTLIIGRVVWFAREM